MLRAVALILLAIGGVALGAAALRGELTVGFFLIIPYVAGSGGLAALGMLALMAGLVTLFLSAAPRAERPHPSAPDAEEAAPRARSGGVVLLGPIPIVWGDARVLPWMVAAGVALLLLALFLTFR